MAKVISSWEELSKEKSKTHYLEIDVDDCNGWIHPKVESDDYYKDRHYLSTHTFYGSQYQESTKVLQSCGFDVILANWDAGTQEFIRNFPKEGYPVKEIIEDNGGLKITIEKKKKKERKKI